MQQQESVGRAAAHIA